MPQLLWRSVPDVQSPPLTALSAVYHAIYHPHGDKICSKGCQRVHRSHVTGVPRYGSTTTGGRGSSLRDGLQVTRDCLLLSFAIVSLGTEAL